MKTPEWYAKEFRRGAFGIRGMTLVDAFSQAMKQAHSKLVCGLSIGQAVPNLESIGNAEGIASRLVKRDRIARNFSLKTELHDSISYKGS
jgi:hypothetical protein